MSEHCANICCLTADFQFIIRSKLVRQIFISLVSNTMDIVDNTFDRSFAVISFALMAGVAQPMRVFVIESSLRKLSAHLPLQYVVVLIIFSRSR